MSVAQKQIRLWPGIAAGALLAAVRFGVPWVAPDAAILGVLGGVAGALLVLIWWLFFSRLPWSERLAGVALIPLGIAAVWRFLDPSIAGGMMGRMYPIYAIPGVCLALVIWAVATQRLSSATRLVTMAGFVLFACAAWTLARTDGVMGEGTAQLKWRWTKSHEETLLARTVAPEPVAPPVKPVEEVKPAVVRDAPPPPPVPDWPGFRGPGRDSVVRGTHISTDWAAAPPKQVWKSDVGPGWSSFAVGGGLIYTQEQRGEFEQVSCYRLDTGAPVWTHRDKARFYESNGGAGPRGTPSLHQGRVYSVGATGIVNALDARTGAVIWTHNAADDTGAKLPGWGFSSSPLIVGDGLVVAASGRLAAYEIASGKLRWTAQTGGGSYSSPQLATIDGAQQIVMLNGSGATSVDPSDGKVLWKNAWEGSAILQPAMMDRGGLLITTGDMMGGVGTRRLAITKAASGWAAEEKWTSKSLKPYFNDLVVHKGLAFGFDGSILSCIDLQDGNRKWKGGRYGHGQMLLLADQDLLLVLSEEGEVALVKAVPDEFSEVSKFKAIEGKTWNHPVLVRDMLLVRNSEEMAAFRLNQISDK